MSNLSLEPVRASGRLSGAVVVAALAASMAVCLLGSWQDFTMPIWFHLRDAGFFIGAGARLAAGEVPYRDFVYAWPPLGPLFMALAFRLFGVNLVAAKLPLAILVGLAVPLTYAWLRTAFARGPALAGALLILLTAPVALRLPYATPQTLAPALFVFLLLARLRADNVMRLTFLAGIGCGVAIGLKHNVGILVGIALWTRLLCGTPYSTLVPAPYNSIARAREWAPMIVRTCATLAALGALAVLAIRIPTAKRTWVITLLPAGTLSVAAAVWAGRTDWRARAPVALSRLALAAVIGGVGIALAVVPWVLWLWRHEALRPFLEYGLLTGREDGTMWAAFYGKAFSPSWPGTGLALCAGAGVLVVVAGYPSRRRHAWMAAGAAWGLVALALHLEGRAGLYLWARYAPTVLIAALALGPWHGTDRNTSPAFHMLVAGAWYSALAFPAATLPHSILSLIPALAVGTALVCAGSGGRTLARPVAFVAVLLALLGSSWVVWGSMLIRPSPSGYRLNALARAPGPHGGTWMPAETADQFADTMAFVDANTPPDGTLVAWPSLALLNVLTARRNPTSLDYFWQGLVGPELEARLLQELRESPPDCVVLDGLPTPVSWAMMERFHPQIGAFIDSRYERRGYAGGFALLVQKPADPPPHPPR